MRTASITPPQRSCSIALASSKSSASRCKAQSSWLASHLLRPRPHGKSLRINVMYVPSLYDHTCTWAFGFSARTKCGSAALIASIREAKSALNVAESDLLALPPPLRPTLLAFAESCDTGTSSKSFETNFSLLP
jgi:hypothetical protein